MPGSSYHIHRPVGEVRILLMSLEKYFSTGWKVCETMKFALIFKRIGIEVQPYLEYSSVDIHEFLHINSCLAVMLLLPVDST
jgi:hypothetical protein